MLHFEDELYHSVIGALCFHLILCLCTAGSHRPWRLARAATDSHVAAVVTMWPCCSPTKPPPALSHKLMDKNTQQIPHSLSIEIQGQLPATRLPKGMYKQRQMNTCTHINTNRDRHTHAMAPSETTSYCSLGCAMTTVCIFGVNCCHCCFVCLGRGGAVFLSRTWLSDIDMLRHLCWEDSIMQYISISRFCTIGNMTFQPSTMAIWLPVVCLSCYSDTGCLPPHPATLSFSLCSSTHF